ncbi:uncharacterized protein LOC126329113 [Schistocerca gregaria]|uniref:uncharacterized protein LOC126329113 n=1 Tax=Schistocerca gregaria TaxID=7010 RepID=UPI00211DEC09|nr:uncharacterized protein LOC126329113 [Schistocerca gregaria]XP_049852084.1 uncharacterized protein LOC126329113 [Schistocerca gregaria]
MTRFARAHGSKSSNERLPEAATSWNVMKQQLTDKLQSSKALGDSATSFQKIWKSSDFDRDVWNKNEVKWADLEDSECADKTVKSGEEYNTLEKKNKKRKHNKTFTNEHFPETIGDNQKKKKKMRNRDSTEFHESQYTGIELPMPDGDLPHTSNVEKAKKPKKMKKETNDEEGNVNDIELEKHEMSEEAMCEESGISPKFTMENNMKKKLGKKRKRSHDSISGIQDEQPARKYGSGLNGKENVNLEKSGESEASDHQLKKKHKRSKNKNKTEESGCLNFVKQNFHEEGSEIIPGADADVVPSEKHRKKKKCKDNGSNTVVGVDASLNGGKPNFQLGGNGSHTSVTSENVQNEGREKKRKKLWQQENNKKFMKKHNFSVEDRKIKKGEFEKKYLHTTVLHVNGKDIKIVKFDGFPVKKEDAENLIQLKKKMIANGIPASEIKATMKLERRKAEKALAREKKKVCFHCRNSGHVLSECPDLGKADTDDLVGTGICFKCGSTEHKHFECRVTREQEFRYAKCFICNEQGHIARQCPDNPRGLYPKGGACHICGDVTHLKKDCPDLIKEKEEKIIKLQTLTDKALEALEDDKNAKSASLNDVKKKKTVKF